jgi:hypothetical protein
MAWLGEAWQGRARQGKGHSVGVLRIVSAAGECYGSAWQGAAWLGVARQGKGVLRCTWWRSRIVKARPGLAKAGSGLAGRGNVGGLAGRGIGKARVLRHMVAVPQIVRAGQGGAGQGTAWQGRARQGF